MPTDHILLVNADDFGLHADIDRGILDCIERGRVQSISFSAQGQSLDWNKLLELQRASVRVGLHVTLVGEPWMTDGRVVESWKQLVIALLRGGESMRAAVELEIQRQFAACAEHGLAPETLAHVDSHQHVHVFSGVWEPCFRMAREHGIDRVRVPWSPSLRLIKPTVGGAALQWLSARRRRQAPGFLPCLGLAYAGHNSAQIFARELSRSAGRDVELCVHPGVNTPALEHKYASWRFEWTRERDALRSMEFDEAVRRGGFRYAPLK
jgi:predicted glycoside hydrolase/deacetylase ChbG (UPF0249 family)